MILVIIPSVHPSISRDSGDGIPMRFGPHVTHNLPMGWRKKRSCSQSVENVAFLAFQGGHHRLAGSDLSICPGFYICMLLDVLSWAALVYVSGESSYSCFQWVKCRLGVEGRERKKKEFHHQSLKSRSRGDRQLRVLTQGGRHVSRLAGDTWVGVRKNDDWQMLSWKTHSWRYP